MKTRFSIAVMALGLNFWTFAQFSVGGGMSVLKGFGGPRPYVGLHLTGELPRDDYSSIFLRAAFYGRQRDIMTGGSVWLNDLSGNTSDQKVNYRNSMNYIVIEGGNRIYIGEGYDNGFGAYGGGTLQVIFNSVKRDYDLRAVDMSKYELPGDANVKGTIFGLGFGLNGGLKYSFAGHGTAYFESGFTYALPPTASNSTASGAGKLYSPLFFSFSLGFRKEFY